VIRPPVMHSFPAGGSEPPQMPPEGALGFLLALATMAVLFACWWFATP
jgi:hypothetical protein